MSNWLYIIHHENQVLFRLIKGAKCSDRSTNYQVKLVGKGDCGSRYGSVRSDDYRELFTPP